MANVDRTFVSQIERGIGNPSLLIMTRLAAALDVELHQLLQPEPPTRQDFDHSP
jgi:transcriptional regulator with XRE-family HTH domain